MYFLCVAPVNLSEGQTVSIALRFEDALLSDNQNVPVGTGCTVTVREIMYLGGMFRFETITAEGTELTSEVPNSEGARLISEGDTIHLSWRPDSLSVLLE